MTVSWLESFCQIKSACKVQYGTCSARVSVALHTLVTRNIELVYAKHRHLQQQCTPAERSIVIHNKHPEGSDFLLTALTSPKFPFRAKCALKLALALPAHTPHSARSTLEQLSTATRSGFGNAGDRQSITMAVSLKMSAARRYILHSGSRAVPSRCAKRMVPMRPVDSCSTVRSRAVVGEAVESPTPTPGGVVVSRVLLERE